MTEWLYIVLLTLVAGLAMPMGASLAMIENLRPKWLENEVRHGVMAFGGGALLSALAFVLIPKGVKELSVLSVSFYFLTGSLSFLLLDVYLKKLKSPAGNLVAMLSDFLPEALALGAVFTAHKKEALLITSLMVLQNIPEGFNAYREMITSPKLHKKNIISFCLLASLLGPICGLGGYYFFSEQSSILAGVMVFAGGGILSSIFQDIAPQSHLENDWIPTLGAVAGFWLGLMGYMLT